MANTIEHLVIGGTTYDLPTGGSGGLGSDMFIRDAYSWSQTLAASASTTKQITITDRSGFGYVMTSVYVSVGTQYFRPNLDRINNSMARVYVQSTRASSSTTSSVSLFVVWTKTDYVTQSTFSV